MTQTANYNPIEEKFLDRKDIFALEFDEGLVFLQVESWEQVKFEPYTGIGEIGPESDSGYQRLEHDGDDILHIPDKKKKVIHASIGQSPSFVRRYTNYPEGENRLRTMPNLNVPRASKGTDYGHVDGNDSPYQTPTDVQELVIPPSTHLDFSFYNPDENKTVEPVLNIKMREYNVKILRPSRHKNTIRRVVEPGSPMPIYPVGGIDNQKRFDNLADEWKVTPISAKRAASNGGGR